MSASGGQTNFGFRTKCNKDNSVGLEIKDTEPGSNNNGELHLSTMTFCVFWEWAGWYKKKIVSIFPFNTLRIKDFHIVGDYIFRHHDDWLMMMAKKKEKGFLND